jgi:hypothetical protein
MQEVREGELVGILNVFKVLYSPFKAFEEIAKAPTISGPIIILFITLVASAGVYYVSSSKTLLETEEGFYAPLTATTIFTQQLISNIGDAVFVFLLKWLVYGFAFLFVLKLFRAKEGSWHHLFIVVGHLFIVTTIFSLINGVIIYTLPTIRFEFDIWNRALQGDQEMLKEMMMEYERAWSFVYQLRPYLSTIVMLWTAFLGAIAIHFLREVSWNKALIISTIVSVISLLLLGPLAFI